MKCLLFHTPAEAWNTQLMKVACAKIKKTTKLAVRDY